MKAEPREASAVPTHWLVAALSSAGWAPAAVFALHVCASCLFGIYTALPSFDIPMHVGGGVAIAYFLWRASALALAAASLGSVPFALHATLVMALTSTAAVAWELAEFVSDAWFGTRAQAGLGDTLLDMLLGVAGGAVFVAWTRLRRAV